MKALQAVELQHLSPENQINLAYLHKQKEEYTKALAILTQVLAKEPDNHYALNNRGMIHLAQNHFPKALPDFKRASELKLDYADPLFNLATLYEKQQNFQQALLYYRKYRLHPHHDRSLISKITKRIQKLHSLWLYLQRQKELKDEKN